eukprot:CAMPEP_0182544042 /NCGR_PEP_ID=MMETSP1323-20130603/32548_1 /TAXON_ID=236787 /ORGANISM="Florenciella parvula, Strain RCC1693" /LENGTH=58 /DNA_ID=CAMNT_0024755041 /DNA_START=91 /DNA_END=264 /DNA_ORIENTATION=-
MGLTYRQKNEEDKTPRELANRFKTALDEAEKSWAKNFSAQPAKKITFLGAGGGTGKGK